MVDRYDLGFFDIMGKFVDGRYVLYEDYQKLEWELAKAEEVQEKESVRQLKSQVAHWKANHDRVVERLRLFTERDDLPVDRLPAYQRMIKLQEENKVLKELMYLTETQKW